MIRPDTGGKTFRVYLNKKPPLPAPPAPEVQTEPVEPKKAVRGRPRQTEKIVKPPKVPKERKFIKERYKRRNAVGDVVTTPAGHQIFTDKWGVENIKLHITRKTRI